MWPRSCSRAACGTVCLCSVPSPTMLTCCSARTGPRPSYLMFTTQAFDLVFDDFELAGNLNFKQRRLRNLDVSDRVILIKLSVANGLPHRIT
jgi:hypothetical protein